MEYLPILSLLISLASIIIAVLSYRRTRKIQDYEYAPRLHMESEEVVFDPSGLTNKLAIKYSGTIENKGTKPVKITRIHLDFGDESDQKKRIQRVIENEIHLSLDQAHPIQIDVYWLDIEDVKGRFNINKVLCFLCVSYQKIDGKIEQVVRNLGGYDGKKLVTVQRSRILV